MEVKISKQWLKDNVFNHSINGKLWQDVISDLKRIGTYKFDVKFRDNDGRIYFYGIRVLFEDKRLYYNRLYVTVPKGKYRLLKS